MGAMLGGADFIKFGYVSRVNPKDSTQHMIPRRAAVPASGAGQADDPERQQRLGRSQGDYWEVSQAAAGEVPDHEGCQSSELDRSPQRSIV